MDADRINLEVLKRKLRAKKLGIADVAFEMYYKYFRFYPSWIKSDRNRSYVYTTVNDAIDLEKGIVSIVLDGRKYEFLYSERQIPGFDESFTMGSFQIRLGENLVFECDVDVDYPKDAYSGISRKPGAAKAFIEGDWVAELITLAPLVTAHHAEQLKLAAQKEKEDPEKLAELKKRFGID